MKNNLLKASAVAGGLYVFLSILFGLNPVWVLKLVMHVMLLVYYFKNVKEINWLVPVGFIAVALGEVAVAIEFLETFYFSTSMFIVFFSVFCWLLWRPLKLHLPKMLKEADLFAFIAGVAILVGIVYLFAQSIKVLDFSILYAFGVVVLVLFVLFNLLLYKFNSAPLNLLFFNVGVCYFFLFLGLMIYQLFVTHPVVLGAANSCEVIAQISLIRIMVAYKYFLKPKPEINF